MVPVCNYICRLHMQHYRCRYSRIRSSRASLATQWIPWQPETLHQKTKEQDGVQLIFIIQRVHLYKCAYSWKFIYQYSCYLFGHPWTCAEQWRIWVPQHTHFQVIVIKVMHALFLLDPSRKGQWTAQDNKRSCACRGQLNMAGTPALAPVSHLRQVI